MRPGFFCGLVKGNEAVNTVYASPPARPGRTKRYLDETATPPSTSSLRTASGQELEGPLDERPLQHLAFTAACWALE